MCTVCYRTVVKNSPEIIRSSLLPFFNNAADDLANLVENLQKGRFSHVKGTITRGATSLNYVHMVLLPVLSSLFDHLGRNKFGPDLIGKQEFNPDFIDTCKQEQVRPRSQ